MNSYWLNIYKPRGISSAKLVSMVKKILGKVKVGHAGTLDVEAEGLCCINKICRERVVIIW